MERAGGRPEPAIRETRGGRELGGRLDPPARSGRERLLQVAGQEGRRRMPTRSSVEKGVEATVGVGAEARSDAIATGVGADTDDEIPARARGEGTRGEEEVGRRIDRLRSGRRSWRS